MKRALAALLVTLVTLGVVGVVETARARAALERALAAHAEGREADALVAARVAQASPVPFTDHAERASALLNELAEANARSAPDLAALARRSAPTVTPSAARRGPLSWGARVSAALAVLTLIAAAWCARRERRRNLLALSALATLLLVIARWTA